MKNKKAQSPLFTVSLIFTVIFVIWAVISFKLITLNFQNPIDIYAEDFDIKAHGEGGHIETEIYASLGTCVEETTEHKTNGVTTSTDKDYYYLVPVFSGDTEYMICVKVSSDDAYDYNKISDATWDFLYDETAEYIDSNPIKFQGTINEVDDEIYGYMKDFFKGMGYYESDSEISKYVLPYYLQPMNFDNASVYLVILIVLFVLTIVFWVLFFVSRSKRKAKEALEKEQFQAQFPGLDYDNYVVINGMSFPKSSLERVNVFINNHETVVAIKELRDVTGLGLADAKNVIDNWNQYYR